MSEPLGVEERARLRALADAATPGPWLAVVPSGKVRRKQQYSILGVESLRGQGEKGAIAVFAGLNGHRADDAELCAAARTAIPALLDEVDRLTEALASEDVRLHAEWRKDEREGSSDA